MRYFEFICRLLFKNLVHKLWGESYVNLPHFRSRAFLKLKPENCDDVMLISLKSVRGLLRLSEEF